MFVLDNAVQTLHRIQTCNIAPCCMGTVKQRKATSIDMQVITKLTMTAHTSLLAV